MEKKSKYSQIFILTSTFIFVAAGTAKALSALGDSNILNELDPLFGLKNRYLMFVVGVLELGVSAYLALGNHWLTKTFAIICLTTNITLYRIGLWWVDAKKTCGCLGDLSSSIGLSDQSADLIMKCILAYLLLGGIILIIIRRNDWNLEFKPD